MKNLSCKKESFAAQVKVSQHQKPNRRSQTGGGKCLAPALAVVGEIDVEIRVWREPTTLAAGSRGGAVNKGKPKIVPKVAKLAVGSAKTEACASFSSDGREWHQAFERGGARRPCCILCLEPYPEIQRTRYASAFCSQECSAEYAVRSSQSTARRQVRVAGRVLLLAAERGFLQLYAVDKGVCRICGLDAHALYGHDLTVSDAGLILTVALRFGTRALTTMMC